MAGDIMQNESNKFAFFSTGFEHLKRSITMLLMVSVFIAVFGKMIDLFFLEILSIFVMVPITIIMTIVDYRRLIKKRIEKSTPRLLIKLLIWEAITLIVTIIIYFSPVFFKL